MTSSVYYNTLSLQDFFSSLSHVRYIVYWTGSLEVQSFMFSLIKFFLVCVSTSGGVALCWTREGVWLGGEYGVGWPTIS